MEFVNSERFQSIFPFLMVSMKSGTSFYRVDSPTSMYRVGGSPIGGATVMGMARHMLPAKCSRTPADILRCGKTCDFSPLDLLVSDIYGGDYPSIGLKGNTVASSFGKANNKEQREHVKSSEIARSLMNLMSMNTAQLAYLHASLYGIDNVVFVGYLLDTHLLQVFSSIQSSFNFWTGGRMKALYFRHAHYLGALGALLKRESTLATMTPGRELIPCDTVTLEQSLLDERLTNLNVSVNTASKIRKNTVQPWELDEDDDEDELTPVLPRQLEG
ncbi:Pantothenate kinase 1 [Perkinsus olseni]|uniref:Pantothenate kinase 1 n=1 Tax=Perkinsus olseni TaxID=32597 RepID=A0A7J6NWG9_PEROL|nr:Pantothenate kinase 1 [Perkinsus olseni]